MDFTFLKNNAVAFVRDDAEQADWTQEEMSISATFPLVPAKEIERGMTVLFRDPATGDYKAFEIRNLQTFMAEGYQQFTAEDIAVSELTDCHIADDIELTNVTPQAALTRILSGTGWTVGDVGATDKSSGDILRGSVWEGVSAIRNNWNVNILSRVTISANGITERKLDILSPEGTWRGLRLSIDKNCADPCVTYDDSELYTALYGYGASYSEGDTPETQTTKETNFSGITWAKTSEHPAKPAGQKYLEWAEKTALYGRNGKPRFGYYQNSSIKDPAVLLKKTWETLKVCSEPKISISGTVTDLRRFGYADEPLRLYDMAIVDLGDRQFYKQIIRLTVNLLDATANTPTIGDYIPTIIYINRETENYATGGSKGVSAGGGGRGGGGTRSNKQKGEFETDLLQNERNIILEARQVDENRNVIKAAGMSVDPITGVIVYADDVKNGIGANFKVQSNLISAEVANRKNADSELSAKINVTARRISLVVTEKDGKDVVNSASIVAGINKDHGSYIRLQADTINLDGYVTMQKFSAIEGDVENLSAGNFAGVGIRCFTMAINAGQFTLGGDVVFKRTIKDGDGNTVNVLKWG